MEIRLLVKFGAKEHLERMQKKGILYCNTITYFSTIEDEHRGDPFESVNKLQYRENTVIQLKLANDPMSEWKNLNLTRMLYRETCKEPLGTLFCMSAFKLTPTKDISIFHFDKRFLDFRYALIILRQDIFIQRLQEALSKLNFKTCINIVEYLHLHKYSGEKNLFQKNIKYSWQEELRIIFYTNKYKKYDPFEFSIGNFEDTSEIIDLNVSKSLYYRL